MQNTPRVDHPVRLMYHSTSSDPRRMQQLAPISYRDPPEQGLAQVEERPPPKHTQPRHGGRSRRRRGRYRQRLGTTSGGEEDGPRGVRKTWPEVRWRGRPKKRPELASQVWGSAGGPALGISEVDPLGRSGPARSPERGRPEFRSELGAPGLPSAFKEADFPSRLVTLKVRCVAQYAFRDEARANSVDAGRLSLDSGKLLPK